MCENDELGETLFAPGLHGSPTHWIQDLGRPVAISGLFVNGYSLLQSDDARLQAVNTFKRRERGPLSATQLGDSN